MEYCYVLSNKEDLYEVQYLVSPLYTKYYKQDIKIMITNCAQICIGFIHKSRKC